MCRHNVQKMEDGILVYIVVFFFCNSFKIEYGSSTTFLMLVGKFSNMLNFVNVALFRCINYCGNGIGFSITLELDMKVSVNTNTFFYRLNMCFNVKDYSIK